MTNGRAYPARPVLAVSLAVIRDGRVLLARRGAPPWQGRFSLPGGGVELGETLAEAALRETFEEVRVRADILGFNRHVEVVERDGAGVVQHHYVIASFVGLWRDGEGTCGPEATDIRWARPEDLAHLPVTEHLAPVLAGAFRIMAGL